MPHSHRISPSSKTSPATKTAKTPKTKDFQPVTPDPLAPLLDPDNPIDFAHNRIAGRVFGQFLGPRNKRNHPTDFYVEWPTNSGSLVAVNLTKLVAICGEVASSRHPVFTKNQAARLLSVVKPGFGFEKLLHHSRP
jgi:hypothetical protein